MFCQHNYSNINIYLSICQYVHNIIIYIIYLYIHLLLRLIILNEEMFLRKRIIVDKRMCKPVCQPVYTYEIGFSVINNN